MIYVLTMTNVILTGVLVFLIFVHNTYEADPVTEETTIQRFVQGGIDSAPDSKAGIVIFF